jgi:hypothetical protein
VSDSIKHLVYTCATSELLWDESTREISKQLLVRTREHALKRQ